MKHEISLKLLDFKLTGPKKTKRVAFIIGLFIELL